MMLDWYDTTFVPHKIFCTPRGVGVPALVACDTV